MRPQALLAPLLVGLCLGLCPRFDVAPHEVPKCNDIADHRLCISAALNSIDNGLGVLIQKSPVDPVTGGSAPNQRRDFDVNCQIRASQIRVHVLYHGKNTSLGDGGDCNRARVAFTNATCSHFATCAAEACILAGFGPVGEYEKLDGTTQVFARPHPEEITIKRKDVARILMPRSDLHRFADVLGLSDPDAFYSSRDARPSDGVDLVPVNIPLDPVVDGEIALEQSKERVRRSMHHQ
eukprot:c32500_g1_i1.p1 GENE.c32500_g1_i1~~c32500_g1_i1.p1  ORF type:complete len:237 (-),score=25.80 c32500_g1_i1:34-744(-)